MSRFIKPYKKPAENRGVDPIVRWVWEEMQRQRVTQTQLANMSGFSTTSLRNWFQGRSGPDYAAVRALVNALGYELLVEKSA